MWSIAEPEGNRSRRETGTPAERPSSGRFTSMINYEYPAQPRSLRKLTPRLIYAEVLSEVRAMPAHYFKVANF